MREQTRRLWPPLLLIGASTVGYLAIDTYNASRAARVAALPLETPIDALIPFVPSFVFAYLLYYPWLLLPLFVARRAHQLEHVIKAFLLMQVSAFLVFLAMPSQMARPALLPDSLSGDALRVLYQLDPAWNVFPSLHAGHSVLVAMVCWRYRRELFPAVAAGSALIIASTVLIKQHYALDILGGALLAAACMSVVDHLPPLAWRVLNGRPPHADYDGRDRGAVVARNRAGALDPSGPGKAT
jgi:membrane-associated phospholipid phosphatase